MMRLTNELLSAGGLVACCAAAAQAAQLAGGQAAADFANYAITLATSLVGLALVGASVWQRRHPIMNPPDDEAVIASLDRIFAYFAEDEAAKDAVRAVARAVTERRYQSKTRQESEVERQEPNPS